MTLLWLAKQSLKSLYRCAGSHLKNWASRQAMKTHLIPILLFWYMQRALLTQTDPDLILSAWTNITSEVWMELMHQVAGLLLKKYKDEFQTAPLAATYNYLRQWAVGTLPANPLVAHDTGTRHLRDPAFLVSALRSRPCIHLTTLAGLELLEFRHSVSEDSSASCSLDSNWFPLLEETLLAGVWIQIVLSGCITWEDHRIWVTLSDVKLDCRAELRTELVLVSKLLSIDYCSDFVSYAVDIVQPDCCIVLPGDWGSTQTEQMPSKLGTSAWITCLLWQGHT